MTAMSSRQRWAQLRAVNAFLANLERIRVWDGLFRDENSMTDADRIALDLLIDNHRERLSYLIDTTTPDVDVYERMFEPVDDLLV